jgi:hypothetical protein
MLTHERWESFFGCWRGQNEYILIQLDQNTRNTKIEEKQNLQIHKEKKISIQPIENQVTHEWLVALLIVIRKNP